MMLYMIRIYILLAYCKRVMLDESFDIQIQTQLNDDEDNSIQTPKDACIDWRCNFPDLKIKNKIILANINLLSLFIKNNIIFINLSKKYFLSLLLFYFKNNMTCSN